jgi:hypothetical protein
LQKVVVAEQRVCEGYSMSPSTDATSNGPLARTGTLDIVTQAARDGASDAREAAARTWAASSVFASRFVYTTFYTLSYGVVFPTTLLAQAVPRNNAAVRGLIEGAQAARQKVDEIVGSSLESPTEAAPLLAPA